MIHPDREVKYINEALGSGVFATKALPNGTILYVIDSLEVELTSKQFNSLNKNMRDIVDTYSYINEKGHRILSWDNAKYVNHKCECNSMSTGYGFEIAIKDIDYGEEITDEYGLFNLPHAITVDCGCINCRKVVNPTDADTYLYEWDEIVKDALAYITNVEQPLWDHMKYKTIKELNGYLYGNKPYKSIETLRYRPIDDTNFAS